MEDVRLIFTRAVEYKCRDCGQIIKEYSMAYETVDSEEIICKDCYNDNYDYRDINLRRRRNMTKRELFEALDYLLSRAKADDQVVFVKKDKNKLRSESYYSLIEPRKLEMVCYEPKTAEDEYPIEWAIELL